MATPRAQARARTMTEIVRIGRRHLETDGAAGLSLRAVARDLGVVSSAVYRYVPSRDDLLTLLVVDAYTHLGDAVDRAESAVPREDLVGRWRTLSGAVRRWAVAEPSRYGLLFGAPVPGYRAPAAQTTAPGTRVITLLLTLAADAERAGSTPRTGRAPDAGLLTDLRRVREQNSLDVSDAMLVATVTVWAALFGAVGFEVFGQYGANTFSDPGAVFDAQCDLLGDLLGIGT